MDEEMLFMEVAKPPSSKPLSLTSTANNAIANEPERTRKALPATLSSFHAEDSSRHGLLWNQSKLPGNSVRITKGDWPPFDINAEFYEVELLAVRNIVDGNFWISQLPP